MQESFEDGQMDRWYALNGMWTDDGDKKDLPVIRNLQEDLKVEMAMFCSELGRNALKTSTIPDLLSMLLLAILIFLLIIPLNSPFIFGIKHFIIF